MKNNLVLYPSKDFILNDHNNIFIDVFTLFQFNQDKYSSFNHDYVMTRTDSEYRKKNFLLSDKIYFTILKIIKDEFNRIYNKNFDSNFYEIIIGAWLRFFIYQFVNKYKSILKAIENYQIDKCTIYETKKLLFAVNDSASFHHAPNSNEWNTGIYSYILENLETKIDLKKIILHDNLLFNLNKNKKKKKNKNFIKILFNFILDRLPNNSDKFIYKTGFGEFNEKKFEILLNQIPRFYHSDFNYDISNYNYDLRSKFKFENYKKEKSKKFNEENESIEILNLILNILSKSIPIIFVEDFIFMLNFSEKLKFPKKPQSILTTFAYETNEPFKFYLANKKFNDKNLKYFIFQHGTFIPNTETNFHHILKTADCFITWGKKKNPASKSSITHSNFKLLNKKYFVKNKSDKILILTRSSGSNMLPFDNFSDKLNKISSMTKFLKKIDDKFKSKIIIRAHKNTKNIFKNFDEFFNIDNFKFKIDYGKTPYLEAINNNKLIIFGYDSSGILEAINIDKPFVGLWPNLFDHLNEFAIRDYKILRKAKILFDEPDELIEHINNIWDNIDEWWYSETTKNSLSQFSENYSIEPDKYFFKKLKKMLQN
jgi:putative transferase (TIGR04331 family)